MSDRYGKDGWDHRREQLERIERREDADVEPATTEELAGRFKAYFEPITGMSAEEVAVEYDFAAGTGQ